MTIESLTMTSHWILYSCSFLNTDLCLRSLSSVRQVSSTFLYSVAYMAIFWWLFVIFISSFGAIISYLRYGRTSAKFEKTSCAKFSFALPPVTILRPLKGLDFNLERNLESSFNLNYPSSLLQLIFLVAHADDPAVPFVQSLILKYPNVASKLIISDEIVGVNPKINNLIKGYQFAKHNLLWVCDSNIDTGPDTLAHSVLSLTTDPTVGLVHQLPVAHPPTTFGSLLEWSFLNMTHAKLYLGINGFGQTPCVIGKSTFFRKTDLEQCGGLNVFGKYLAEDIMIATAIWNMQLQHKMTGDIAHQSLGPMTLKEHFSRRLRWTRIRRFTLPYTAILEPISECIVLGVIFALSLNFLYQVSITYTITLHTLIWLTTDLAVVYQLCPNQRPPLWKISLAWLVRELSAFPLYLIAVCGNTVSWRDGNYQLVFDGTIQKIG